jgi:hypothetical protein
MDKASANRSRKTAIAVMILTPFQRDRTIRLLFATGGRPLNNLRRRGWYWDKGDLILSLSQYI